LKAKLLIGVSLAMLGSAVVAGPKGVVPRASANSYPTHTGNKEIEVGAALLSPQEVRKAFSFDVVGICLVVEVALFPKDNERKVSIDDFSLHIGNENVVKPSRATSIAAKLPQQSVSTDEVTVTPSAEVLVGPRTVHTEAEVGIEDHRGAPHPVSDKDRDIAEAELANKGLPEGKVSAPVAGYLYFSIPVRKRRAALRLDCEVNGTKVVLQFSEK
jgi:hypothetical protein